MPSFFPSNLAWSDACKKLQVLLVQMPSEFHRVLCYDVSCGCCVIQSVTTSKCSTSYDESRPCACRKHEIGDASAKREKREGGKFDFLWTAPWPFCSKAINGGKEWRWTWRTKRVKKTEKGRAKKGSGKVIEAVFSSLVCKRKKNLWWNLANLKY